MRQEPTAFELLRLALAPMLDVAGLVLLIWFGLQVMFGGSQDFLTAALWLGGIGVLACWVAPGAARNVPLPMLAYVGIALLSAGVHRWPAVTSAAEPEWRLLFTPAFHLVIMTLFVTGGAYLMRTPWRLSAFTVLLAVALTVIAAQTLFDRVSTNFVYAEGGSVSLPSVSQWGGMHQIGLLLVIAFPLVASVAFFTRSLSRITAGLGLGAALLLVAILNGSRSGIVTMVISAAAMGGVSFVAAGSARWRPRYYVLVFGVLLIGLWYGLAQVASSRPPLSSVTSGRLPIWTAATRIIRDHPWLGVGPGNYTATMVDGGYAERYLPRYASRLRNAPDPAATLGTEQAHNMLLHVAAETGVAGAVSLLAFWLWMLSACWRSLVRSQLQLVSLGLLVSLGAFLLRSTYDNFLDNLVTVDRTRVLVWMLFGAALSLQRLLRPRS